MVGPFLPPLTNEKLLPWWKERISEANQGTRVIILLLPETAPGKKPLGPDLRGLAMFKLSGVETGTFRGRIDAVLVNQKHRRQGGARALVTALEYEAAKRGRTLLVRNSCTKEGGSAFSVQSHTLEDLLTVWDDRHSSWTLRLVASRRQPSRSLDTLRWAKSRPTVGYCPTARKMRRFSTKTCFLRRRVEQGRFPVTKPPLAFCLATIPFRWFSFSFQQGVGSEELLDRETWPTLPIRGIRLPQNIHSAFYTFVHTGIPHRIRTMCFGGFLC